MVTEEAYASVITGNATLRHELAAVRTELATAMQQLAALEAKKPPPPSFVKANRPAGVKTPRRRRAAAQNHARRREEPAVVVTHALAHSPDCGGVSWAARDDLVGWGKLRGEHVQCRRRQHNQEHEQENESEHPVSVQVTMGRMG